MSENNGNHQDPILEVRNISKLFGSVIALADVSARVYPGEVTCILGDNGAGKSTLIKTLAGVHKPTSGDYIFEGEKVTFNSPRDALDAGIATVYQDLALVPLMSVWRNFFLGSEPTKGFGPFRRINMNEAKNVSITEMKKMGIDVRDPEQPVGTMSGGERQSVAISRAIYFGAKVLILDEPTAALGVKQSGTVLRYILEAPQSWIGRDLHHPQSTPRVSSRRSLCGTAAREGLWRFPQRGDRPRQTRLHDGRWPGFGSVAR